jgi:hypothetical protein
VLRQTALLVAICLGAPACQRTGSDKASPAGSSSAAPPQVMLEPPPPGAGNRKPIGPFYFARHSDVIAIATIGPKLMFAARSAVRLDLERILYGRVGSRSVLSPDELPSYGCFPPQEPTLASNLFSVGTKVIVYLSGSLETGFSLRNIAALPTSGPDPELLRYTEARRLRESPRASLADYRRLLKRETWKDGSGALSALEDDARAVPVLLEQLESCGDAKSGSPAALAKHVSTILQLMPSRELHRGIEPAIRCVEQARPMQRGIDIDAALVGAWQKANAQELARLRKYAQQRFDEVPVDDMRYQGALRLYAGAYGVKALPRLGRALRKIADVINEHPTDSIGPHAEQTVEYMAARWPSLTPAERHATEQSCRAFLHQLKPGDDPATRCETIVRPILTKMLMAHVSPSFRDALRAPERLVAPCHGTG